MPQPCITVIQSVACMCVLLYPVFSKAQLLLGHEQLGPGLLNLTVALRKYSSFMSQYGAMNCQKHTLGADSTSVRVGSAQNFKLPLQVASLPAHTFSLKKKFQAVYNHNL